MPFEEFFRTGFSRTSGWAIATVLVLMVAGILALAMYEPVPSGERSTSVDGSLPDSPLSNPTSAPELGGEAALSGADADAGDGDQQYADNGAPTADGRARRQAEFAELMQARADSIEKTRSSMATVKAARATSGLGAQGTHTATGQAYRKAALAVESALAAHPELQALQTQHDELQEQKREQSREIAAILDSWRTAQRSARRDYDAAVLRLSEDFMQQQKALLESENAQSPGRLTTAGKQRYQEMQANLTNVMAEVSANFEQSITEESVQAQREADGSRERFDALRAELAAIQSKQEALKQAMQARRDALRTQAPEIASLQEAARAASRQHLKAVQARPEVAQALAWVKGAEERQRELDERANGLYNRILSEFPDLRDELDALARQGGLVLTGDTIRMASGQAGMTGERNQQ